MMNPNFVVVAGEDNHRTDTIRGTALTMTYTFDEAQAYVEANPDIPSFVMTYEAYWDTETIKKVLAENNGQTYSVMSKEGNKLFDFREDKLIPRPLFLCEAIEDDNEEEFPWIKELNDDD